MTYIHTDQFRCAIIRGKAQIELDNLLPFYASVISEICPTSADNFFSFFKEKLEAKFGKNITDKALNNHRTEIAGKLFGMYYIDAQEVVHISERTLKLLEDNDQPAFFKDLCFKMQFPSGMNVKKTVFSRMDLGINIRQLCYVVAVLKACEKLNIFLEMEQIGYYVLNSLSALTRQANVEEVVLQIEIDIKANIIRKVPNPLNKKPSYTTQHIREQLTLLQLANVLIRSGRIYKLNYKENAFIDYMIKFAEQAPEFDFYSIENIINAEVYDRVQIEWDYFMSKISDIPAELLKLSLKSKHVFFSELV